MLSSHTLLQQKANALSVLPDEIINLLLEHLQAPELARLGMTCKDLHRRCTDQLLWSNLLVLDFRYQSPCIAMDSKSVYVQHIVEFKRRETNRVDAECKRIKRLQLQTKRRKLHRMFSLFDVHLTLPLLGSCALAALGLISNYNAHIVFIPIWCFIAYLFCGIPISLLLFATRNKADSILHNMWDFHSSPAAMWIKHVGPMFKTLMLATMFAFTVAALVLTFLILLLVRLSDEDSVTWNAAFAPLWVAFILLFALFVPPINRFNTPMGREVLAIIIVPTFVFAILLPTWLEQPQDMALSLVFIPLYIQDGIYLALVLFGATANCYREGDFALNLFYWFMASSILAPLVAFEVLIVQHVDVGSVELDVALIPLFLWFACFTAFFILSYCLVEDAYKEQEGPASAEIARGHWRNNRANGVRIPRNNRNNNDFWDVDPHLHAFQAEFEQMQLDMAMEIEALHVRAELRYNNNMRARRAPLPPPPPPPPPPLQHLMDLV